MHIDVLVVDDEEIIRNIWHEIFLEDEMFILDFAENGNEGIQKVKNHDYDIVVTDLNMPGISGLEVVEKVKKIKPQIEVIVMTAYGTVEYAVSAIKAGAFDFILKPLDFERIKLSLKKCFSLLEFKRENKDLKELNVQLKELNDTKEKFISITSHELRTPANAISGLIDLLHDRLPEKVKSQFEREFDIIFTACNNLKDVVNDMHDLSLAASNRLKVNIFPFEIDTLSNELSLEYKLYSRERDLDFNIDNKLDGQSFNGDIRKIKQAVGELIQNAVKYTKDGGKIGITFSNEKKDEITYLLIEIIDTGIGIGNEQVDKIFDAFYEVQDTTLHHSSQSEFMGGGIGIGLSIVREIVAAHGGRVSVDSELGSGSTFRLHLPCKKLREFKM